MNNNWYEDYVTALETDGAFRSIARSAKNAAGDTIRKTVDWSGPAYFFTFAGVFFGCLSLTADIEGIFKWILSSATILTSLTIFYFAIRATLQNEKRLRRELTLLYYAYYLQYQVIKDATYNIRPADLKHCRETIENLHSDIRSKWPSEDIADESTDFIEKIFRV